MFHVKLIIISIFAAHIQAYLPGKQRKCLDKAIEIASTMTPQAKEVAYQIWVQYVSDPWPFEEGRASC